MQGLKLQLNNTQWVALSHILELAAHNAPIEDYEVESCLLADLYKRKISSLNFFKPGKDRLMHFAITDAEAYALHQLFGSQMAYNNFLRMQVEPKLLPAKSAIR